MALHLQRVPRQLARGRVAGQGAQATVQISGWIQAEERATTTRQRNRTFMVRIICVVVKLREREGQRVDSGG